MVGDGAEALDLLFGRGAYRGRSVSPRLVLLDLQLPKVDGLEVLRQIRAEPRTRPLPVVVLICSRAEGDRVASYQLGVNSYIVKPVDPEQFGAVVRQLGYYWLLLNQPSG